VKTIQLENKTILIAGASGGIGSSAVNKLSNSGANVIAVYNKNRPDLQNRENIYLVKVDLTESEEWNRVLQFVNHTSRKIDVMINCTGVLIPGDFMNHTEEQITEMININFSSMIIGTYKTLKLMRAQGFGQIINIGSVGGIIPMPYSTVYSATKFALRGFTHSLNQELKDSKISVSLVSPGPVNTKMLQLESDHHKTSIAFLNKALKPEQVADSIMKIINKPKTEVIIPSTLSFPSRVFFVFPVLFSKVYKLIEKIGKWRKRFYLKKQYDLSLQK
jgi:short-subunit dehydrogenase